MFLRGALGRAGRKRTRRASRFLGGGSGFLSASTVMAAVGVAWGVYDSLRAQAEGTSGGAAPPLPPPTTPPSTTHPSGPAPSGPALSRTPPSGGQPFAPMPSPALLAGPLVATSPSALPLAGPATAGTPPVPPTGGSSPGLGPVPAVAAGAAGPTRASDAPPLVLPAAVERLVRLAVSAASADGSVADAERTVILEQARAAGVAAVVDQELRTRRPLAEIVAGVSTDAERRDLYVLAFTIVRADDTVSGGERIYLAQLAHALGLDAPTAAGIEQHTATAIDGSAGPVPVTP